MRRHEDWLKQAHSVLKNILIKHDFRQDWIPEFIRYIEEIIEKGAVLIVLFGSRAKGEFLKFSDTLPVQPFVLTPAELEERINKLDFLIFDAFEDGTVLFSSMDMERIHNLLRKSKERFKLERVKNGWKFDAVAAAAAGI